MSWLTLLSSMQSAFCFILAWIYLLMSLQQRQKWGHGLFSCCAMAAGANDSRPTRKFGRGFSNFFLAPAEVLVSVTTVAPGRRRDKMIR
jgi:hypothetical protein